MSWEGEREGDRTVYSDMMNKREKNIALFTIFHENEDNVSMCDA